MQEKNTQYANYFLTRLKSALNITSDVDLSKILGVRTSTISTWKARNSLDYDLIFANCKGVDLNWLITGESLPNNSQNANSIITGGPCRNCELRDKMISQQEKIITMLEEKIENLQSNNNQAAQAPDFKQTA